MDLPIDIAHIAHEWTRLPSQAWTERELRESLIVWLDAFKLFHPWVTIMKLEERFADTGIMARVPFGPTGPEQRQDNFLQRDGTPVLNITAVRESDNREFEVSVPFALGNDTPEGTQLILLHQAAVSLETSERYSRVN